MMQTVTAPGARARTFLIHMFRRGLDDTLEEQTLFRCGPDSPY